MGLFGKKKTTEELIAEANQLSSIGEYLKAAIVLLKIHRSERYSNQAEIEFMLGKCYFMDAQNTGADFPRKEAEKHFKAAAQAGSQKAQFVLQNGALPTSPVTPACPTAPATPKAPATPVASVPPTAPTSQNVNAEVSKKADIASHVKDAKKIYDKIDKLDAEFSELFGEETTPDQKPVRSAAKPSGSSHAKAPVPEKKVQQRASSQSAASGDALQAYERGDFQTSLRLWKAQSESLFGKGEAYYWLGVSYLNGAGVDKNLETAMAWAKKAKEKKYSSADALIKAIEGQQLERLRKQLSHQIHYGEIFTLGSYPTSSSTERKPIDWVVLDKQGPYVFAIVWNCLDAKQYHSQNKPVRWRDCSLRRWLNNDFYHSAFTPIEQKLIVKAPVSKDWNVSEKDDFVSLLCPMGKEYFCQRSSPKGLSQYAYPPEALIDRDPYKYAPSDKKSESAILLESLGYKTDSYMSGPWWLRTSGDKPELPYFVSWTGSSTFVDSTNRFPTDYFLVRPVIWLKLDE